MRNTPLSLIGGFYADETRPWSQQDICNWLPCATEAEGTRTQVMAKTPPGLSPLVSFSNGDDPTRGVYNAEGRLFAVIGSTLYGINSAYVPFPLGTIPGTGRVRFAHNQITGGNQVLVVNGSSGYVYSTVAGVLTHITDDGYPGAFDAVFIDGYLIQIEPARRFAFHSDLADATAYNTLDRFTSEVSPDLLVGLAVNNNELILFSESTAEFFENTGASQQPFRSKRISLQKGCAGRYTIANLDNTVLWLGDDGVFYRLDGYSPIRISTHPVEQAIIGLDWTKAFAFVWESKGHSVCYWTFPDGRTWGYDVSQPPGFQWHRRESCGLNRWRVNGTAYWNKQWVAGDFQSGRLWELDWDYPLEGDEEFVSEVTSPVIHDNQNLVLMPRVEVVMDTGQPLVVAREFPPGPWPGAAPTISGDAPDGAVGAPYAEYTYTVTGDVPLVVTMPTGDLPDGLVFDDGTIDAGTPTTAETQAFTVRVTDAWDRQATLADTITIAAAEIACSADSEYDGGIAFPNEVVVSLGSGTGNITLTYATGPNPDKFEVWIGDVKVIDTGYHGDIASYQGALDAYMASNALPQEDIVQYPGSAPNAAVQWASITDRETAGYYKATADTVALVKIYSPLVDTAWYFNVSCPDGAPPP